MAATIKIEFMAGDTIEESFEEAIRIATLLGVWVNFNINGVDCHANSNGDAKRGVEAYHVACKSSNHHLPAFA